MKSREEIRITEEIKRDARRFGFFIVFWCIVLFAGVAYYHFTKPAPATKLAPIIWSK